MDEVSFDAFYTASFNRLVAHIYAMCGDLGEAQDCVQEAFIRAWDKRRQLDQAQSPEAWVRVVAYRLAVSRWRKHRRARREADRALEPVRTHEATPDRVAIDRALAKISPEQRRVIVLHHLCDLSVAQIAEEIGAPTGTVKARLSRGRQALAPFLADTPEVRHA